MSLTNSDAITHASVASPVTYEAPLLSRADRTESTKIPTAGPIKRAAWSEYVAQRSEQAIQNILQHGIRHCTQGQPGCNLEIEFSSPPGAVAPLVGSDSDQKVTSPEATTEAPAATQYPWVENNSWGFMHVKAPGVKLTANKCHVGLSVVKKLPKSQFTALTPGTMFSQAWSKTYSNYAPAGQPYCDGTGTETPEMLRSTLDKSKSMYSLLCSCYAEDSSTPYTCNTASNTDLYFNFKIALFNAQGDYSLMVVCGADLPSDPNVTDPCYGAPNCYSGSIEFFSTWYKNVGPGVASASPSWDESREDSVTGTSEVAPRSLFWDGDGDGYAAGTNATSNSAYVGEFYPDRPILSGSVFGMSAVVGDSDDSPSTGTNTHPTTFAFASQPAAAPSTSAPATGSLSYFLGESQSDNLAGSATGGFDLNGDGLSDIGIGVPNATALEDGTSCGSGSSTNYCGTGRVYLMMGSTEHHLTGQSLRTAGLDTISQDANSPAVFGDATDRASLTLVGTPGVASDPFTTSGASAGFRLVSGYFDADEFRDLAIAEPYDHGDNGPATNPVPGKVFILFGGNSSIDYGTYNLDVCTLEAAGISAIGLTTSFKDGYFGSDLAAGDLNGDGRDELVIGESQTGREYVIDSTTLSAMRKTADQGASSCATKPIPLNDAEKSASLIFTTGSSTGSLGKGAAVLKDFNGDGLPDLALDDSQYAYSDTSGNHNVGQVLFWWGDGSNYGAFHPGSTGSTVTRAPDVILRGDQDGGFSYLKLSAVPDLNNDGTSELLLGAQQYDPVIGTLTNAGAAFVVLGQPKGSAVATKRASLFTVAASTLTTNGIRRFTGSVNGENLGIRIDVGVGQTLSSGKQEVWLAMGDPGWGYTATSASTSGYGRTLLAAISPDSSFSAGDGLQMSSVRWASAHARDAWSDGLNSALLGDVDGDGSPEVFSIAPWSLLTDLESGGSTTGVSMAYLYYGCSAWSSKGSCFTP